MREITVVFKEGLEKGLRSSAQNPRNLQRLTYSANAFPEDKVLRALEDISQYQLDTYSIETAYPYPQIFELAYVTIVCTEDAIYEYKAGSLTLQIFGLTVGSTWTVADYNRYLVFTNGAQVVIKDFDTQAYLIHTSCDIPECLCLCDVNGQLIVGAPSTYIPPGFIK
jgi:hypothetical protein